jgi:hypothetical protein
LDIKVVEDYSYKTLDRNEYNKHQRKMEYPPKLKRILEQELMELKEMIHNRVGPFDHQTVMAYYTDYQTKHLSKKN